MNSKKLHYTLMDKNVTDTNNLNNYKIQIDGHCVNDINYKKIIMQLITLNGQFSRLIIISKSIKIK